MIIRNIVKDFNNQKKIRRFLSIPHKIPIAQVGKRPLRIFQKYKIAAMEQDVFLERLSRPRKNCVTFLTQPEAKPIMSQVPRSPVIAQGHKRVVIEYRYYRGHRFAFYYQNKFGRLLDMTTPFLKDGAKKRKDNTTILLNQSIAVFKKRVRICYCGNL